ncbi:hypothetical protein DEJ50_21000 [Streptomyces venezuelae]|uniref:Secreted protein n=1 Tax=Streptomyces venezuelae TaxID=54571 RepID=A0A5P2D450_STRVZ|nr:hypothetical protein [Streptomyces venezuelae]QES49934.1 hypothetical protein DEJ50_21000 [Streptomyces venezuelae]
MRIRTVALPVAALAAVASLVAAAPAPGAPGAPADATARTASVHGGGRIFYPYSATHEIRFTVEAEGAPWSRGYPGTKLEKGSPTDARGRVTIHHRVPASETEDGKEFTAVSEARVDCLVTGNRSATLTAVVETSNVGTAGERIGISIEDGRGREPDRLGFSWGVGNAHVVEGKLVQPDTGTCMAPAAFARVVEGGFSVAAAPLAPQPR